MKVILNQSEITIDDGATLHDLILSQGIKPEGIAVAVNNRIVSRAEWGTTSIEEGAKVTIIQATYGG